MNEEYNVELLDLGNAKEETKQIAPGPFVDNELMPPEGREPA